LITVIGRKRSRLSELMARPLDCTSDPRRYMDQLTATAASGMRSRLEALDLLANNISNSGTAGYKSDHEFYNLYVSAVADSQTTVPEVARHWIDFSQGVV